MGCQTNATCQDCGHAFTVDDGGGFFFHLLRCDTCGRTRTIGFNRLGDLHLRYVKGLPAPYRAARGHEMQAETRADLEPISEDDYRQAVERIAGHCRRCGGKYRFDAPPRCPKCRSTKLTEGDIVAMYD